MWQNMIMNSRKKGRSSKVSKSKESKSKKSENTSNNSLIENFFGIMKQEMYYGTVYHSYVELKNAIEKYIKYYNEKRI